MSSRPNDDHNKLPALSSYFDDTTSTTMTDSSAGSSMATAPTELDHSQDSKADLLRRLGKLTARLQGTTRPHENLVNELRKKVDCMEVLLDCSSTDEESENGPDESSQDEGRPAAIQAQRGSTQVTTSPAVTAEDAPARQPSKLDETSHAKDGRALLLRLSSVVEQLQMRHIELKVRTIPASVRSRKFTNAHLSVFTISPCKRLNSPRSAYCSLRPQSRTCMLSPAFSFLPNNSDFDSLPDKPTFRPTPPNSPTSASRSKCWRSKRRRSLPTPQQPTRHLRLA